MKLALRDTPIRKKLVAAVLITSGAVLLLTCATFFIYDVLTFRQATVRHLETLGKIVADNSTAALAFDDLDDAREILGALKAEPSVVAAGLYRADGRIFARYPAGLTDEALPAALEADGYRFKPGFLTGFQPVEQGGNKRLGTLYLESDLGSMSARLRLYGGIVLWVSAASLLMAYGLSRIMQRQISYPILALASAARVVSEKGDFSVRAAKLGKDEVGVLTDAFNQMLGRIEDQNRALQDGLAEQKRVQAEIARLNVELEQRVRDRTAQFEAANKELEAFSYSVSHDLRAPLRHVNGYVELLQREAEGKLSDRARRFLKTISDASAEMARLIDSLLEFSRMGRTEMTEMTMPLKSLTEDTIRSLELETRGRNINWKIDPLPAVIGDHLMLKQVLANLLGNAVKYSRGRDPAEIEIGCAGKENGRVIIFVRDNGAGFDMRYADKLFGVFQRLHRSDEFEGTGIGLANVGRIVKRHGGRVWAVGALNQGATFFFTLAPAPTQ